MRDGVQYAALHLRKIPIKLIQGAVRVLTIE